jgi:recombination associated protein RdgC
MFDQISIFMLGDDFGLPQANEIQNLVQSMPFVPTGATQEKSVGFVPPRGREHGALVEVIGGHYILRLGIETRSVPSRAIRLAVDAKAAEIEASTGRKPGRKERRELSEQALLDLLPAAFPKFASVDVWIDPQTRRLVLGSASQGKSDEALSALIKAVPGLTVSLLQTATSPQAAMTDWLLAPSPDDWPEALHVERACTLKSIGDDAALVKFKNHALLTDEVKKHVTEGKLPTELALNWDGRIAFVLTEHLRLKKIQFLDKVMDATGAAEDEDRFDADVALATGMLTPCLDGLIEALDGLLQWEGQPS